MAFDLTEFAEKVGGDMMKAQTLSAPHPVAAPAILGTVRASSWSTMFDCSLRWYYQNVMKLRLPSGGAARLGTALHKSTAVYDTASVAGAVPSIEHACDALVDVIHDPGADVQWDDDLRPLDAEAIGLALTRRYVAEIVPTHEYRAVEIQCTALDITTDSGVIRLTGTTDRVRLTDDGQEGIADIKSGSKAVDTNGRAVTKGRHLQTGIYKLMAENALQRPLDAPDEIIGLQTGKTERGQRVGVAEIADSRTPLVGFDEVPGLIELAARMLKAGSFPPNPQSYLCSPKYCPGFHKCRFHD